MMALRSTASPRRGLLRSLALMIAGLLILVACGGGSGGGDAGAKLLHYQRVWPDGRIEQQTIYGDGRIEMKHGEVLERLTISPENLARIRTALEAAIPVGSPDDSPTRTLTLADDSVIQAPRPDPGTVTELLEQLLDTHTVA